jgi:hypothetical protein
LRWLAPYQLIPVAFYFKNKEAYGQLILETGNNLNKRTSIRTILRAAMMILSPPLTSTAEV